MSDAALMGLGVEPGRFGARRGADLTEEERELYRWIIRCFAAARPPRLDALSEQAGQLELDRERALERLEVADLICRDPGSGEVVVAYPFSARPTPHTVSIDGVQVHAMCAVDALGVAFMLNRPVTARSRDPETGVQVQVCVDPAKGAIDASPPETVALAGHAEGPGALATLCCPTTNFFASEASARSYLAKHPHVAGWVVSVPDAADAGRVLFGDLLTGR